MSWVAVAAAGTGALVGGIASNMAADTQADAAGQATGLQYGMYKQTRQDLDPWRQTGTLALNQLRGLTGLPSDDGSVAGNPNAQLVRPFGMQDFQQSPAYQFNLEQGMNAINKGANARGNYYAPQTLQDLGKFSQGMASNEFQNAFNNYNTSNNNLWQRLYGLSGAGQNAAAQQGGFGAGAANQIGQNITGAGNAQAAGQIGVGNAVTGGLQNAYNAYLTNQILGQQQQSFYPGS